MIEIYEFKNLRISNSKGILGDLNPTRKWNKILLNSFKLDNIQF
jgi:hypothetical protein